MKTFVFKIKIPDYDFTVHEDQILNDFLMNPGIFIEFIKKGISELSKIDSDEVKLELNKFYSKIYTPILEKVLKFSKEYDTDHSAVNELISKLIKGKS